MHGLEPRKKQTTNQGIKWRFVTYKLDKRFLFCFVLDIETG